MNKKTVQARLSEPNGSEKLMIDAATAFDAAWELFTEGYAPAGAFLCHCAKKKEFSLRIEEKLGPDRTTLYIALQSDNAKLRKNVARLIGQLQSPTDTQALIVAFACETQQFVKPSMILALGAIGTNEARQVLEQYAEQIEMRDDAAVRDKHGREECEALRIALAQFISLQKHTFTHLAAPYTVELRAPEHMGQVLREELIALHLPPMEIHGDCMRLNTSEVQKLYNARCMTELLFSVTRALPTDGAIIAQRTGTALRTLLLSAHSGKPPFGYRIEIRGQEIDRGELTRKIAGALDDDILFNAPGDYEAQLLLEQHKDGFEAYITLQTIPDERFSYRIGAISASIHPTTAAAVLRYAAKVWEADGYVMTKHARVLDPCCGSGTLLIERGKLSPCRALTGIDISHKAIDIARINAKASGEQVSFIVNDCLRFVAKQPYDELIANLPFGNRVGTHEQNEHLYAQILNYLNEWVRPGGVAVLYTMEFTLLRRLLSGQKNVRLLSETRTNAGGLTPGIFILRVGGES